MLIDAPETARFDVGAQTAYADPPQNYLRDQMRPGEWSRVSWRFYADIEQLYGNRGGTTQVYFIIDKNTVRSFDRFELFPMLKSDAQPGSWRFDNCFVIAAS